MNLLALALAHFRCAGEAQIEGVTFLGVRGEFIGNEDIKPDGSQLRRTHLGHRRYEHQRSDTVVLGDVQQYFL